MSTPNRSELRSNRPTPGGRIATVYLDKRGTLSHLTRQLTTGEVMFDTPRAVYLVDLTVHWVEFDLDLPAEEDGFSFQGRVRASWKVGDPCAAVETNLSDGDKVVRGYLEVRLRDFSQSYSIERRAEAQRAFQGAFTDRMVELDQGVHLTQCFVTVEMDESTAIYVRGRVEHQRELEKRERTHEAARKEAELAVVEEREQHTVEEQRAEFRRKQESQDAVHTLALESKRMEHYANALAKGEHNLIALRLSNNPEDANEVLQLFMRQRELDYEGARGMLKALLENGLANRKDVADVMAHATDLIADHLTRSPLGLPGGAPQKRKALPSPSSPSDPITAEIVAPGASVEEDPDEDDEEDV